jgi:hypothetical protein
MKIILRLILFISGFAHACDFRSEITQVYSLSGPVTVALKNIGLLSSSKLKGISVFNPVSAGEFKGKFLPGGVFLSREMVEQLKNSLVFFDESRDLKKMFNSIQTVTSREIVSRGLSPQVVTELIITTLRPFTVSCESQFALFQAKSEKIGENILKRLPEKFSAVFLLGEIKADRLPELVIANDGIVKWLREKRKLATYPSDLAYVNWSSKIMNELPKTYLKIGIKDSGTKMIREIKKVDDKTFNLTYPGSLVPGVSQQEAWLYFLENYQR